MLKKLIPGLAALSLLSLHAQQPAPPALTRAETSVSPDRIREADRFISSDLFEGRYPGLRGGQLAADYIADQFALAGLQPAGDGGSYLQQVNFVGMKAIPGQTSFTLLPTHGPSQKLAYATDYTVANQTLTPTATLDAPIVFVGYGVTAPEFNWNDYAGVDVKGKVILCIVGDPPSDDPKFFGGKALTYYGRWTYKFEQAARMGAVGALIIHRTDLASYGWNVVQNSNTSEKNLPPRRHQPPPQSRQLDPARSRPPHLRRGQHGPRQRIHRRRPERLQSRRTPRPPPGHRYQHRPPLPKPQRRRHAARKGMWRSRWPQWLHARP